VRDLPAETPISYGRTYTTRRPTRTGVVAVGYGHGYSWLLSNRGHMLVRGARVPILGRVTMDLTMVDVTDVAGAAVGDEVVLFGEQGDARLTLEEVAEGSETIPYEIMCTIGKASRALRPGPAVRSRRWWRSGSGPPARPPAWRDRCGARR
jgi:alanine racemase